MAACERILLAGEADFLLCHSHPSVPARFEAARFQSCVVGMDLLAPLASPDGNGAALFKLPEPGAEPVRFLAYSAPSGLGRILNAVGYPPGSRLPLDKVFTSPLAAALQTMARQGHGIAWLPRSLAADDLAAGRLVDAGDDKFSIHVEVRLFHGNDKKSGLAGTFWQAASRR